MANDSLAPSFMVFSLSQLICESKIDGWNAFWVLKLFLIWLDWVKVITWISKLWRFNSQTPWRMNFVIFDFELITGKYRTSDDLLRMIVQQNTWKQLEKVEKTSWPNGMLFWNVYSDVIIVYKQRYKQRRWKKGLQTVSVIRLHEF